MTIFAVSGIEVSASDCDKIDSLAPADLEIISRVGQKGFEMDYISTSDTDAKVSLEDYNITYNGTHFTDFDDVPSFEFFALNWQQGGAQQRSFVLCISSALGCEEAMFVLAGTPLPQFSNAEVFTTFMEQAEIELADATRRHVDLLDIPNVAASGAILGIEEVNDLEAADSFIFEADLCQAIASRPSNPSLSAPIAGLRKWSSAQLRNALGTPVQHVDAA